MTPVSEAGTSAPFKRGDIVETIKGAKFWGEVVSVYDLNSSFPGKDAEWRADVRAVAPDFLGTIHVYPTAQLRIRPALIQPTPAETEGGELVGQVRDAAKALARFLGDDDRGGKVLIQDFHVLVSAMGLLNSAAAALDGAQQGHAAARSNFHTMQGAANELRIRLEASEAQVATLSRQLEEAREALKPFAELADRFDGRDGIEWGDDYLPTRHLPLSDFRRAKETVSHG